MHEAIVSEELKSYLAEPILLLTQKSGTLTMVFEGIQRDKIDELVLAFITASRNELNKVAQGMSLSSHTILGIHKAMGILDLMGNKDPQKWSNNAIIKPGIDFSLKELCDLSNTINQQIINKLSEYKEFISDRLQEENPFNENIKGDEPSIIFLELQGIRESIAIINNRIIPENSFSSYISSEEQDYFSPIIKNLQIIDTNQTSLTFKGINEEKIQQIASLFVLKCSEEIDKYLRDNQENLDEWSISLQFSSDSIKKLANNKNFNVQSIQVNEDFSYQELKQFAKEIIDMSTQLVDKEYKEIVEANQDDEWCIGYWAVGGIIKKPFLYKNNKKLKP